MRTVIHALILYAIAGTILVAACGCAPSSPATDAARAKAAVYATELQVCVETSTTLAESRACRCETARRFQRKCDGE